MKSKTSHSDEETIRRLRITNKILTVCVVGLSSICIAYIFAGMSTYLKPSRFRIESDNDHSKTFLSFPLRSAASFQWCFGYDPNASLFNESLFCENLDLVEQAYQTPFVQGMKTGNMLPSEYAKYDLQDWFFQLETANVMTSICDKSEKKCDQKTMDFLKNVLRIYADGAKAIPKRYSTKSSIEKVIEVIPATQVKMNSK